MSTKLEKIVKLYKSLSQIPALIGGEIQSEAIINTVWSQRNLESGSTSKFSRSILLDNNFQSRDTTLPIDISNELISKVSNTRKLKAVLRENDSKQYLEIWKNNNLFRVVDLAALDVHGAIYTDIEFGAFEFSPDELKLLYVAEKKKTNSEPFYKRKKPDESKEEVDNAKSAKKGEEYLFEQDWGEQLVGKKKSILAEYHIDSDSVVILNGLPEHVCVAQPKYSPNGEYIIGVAYFTEPRKLGLIYCTNRLSTLFQLDFEGNYVELNLKHKAVKSPIFAPDGKTLVWLQRNSGGPHMACMQLVKCNLPLTLQTEEKVVVDFVATKITISNDREFYGIYNTGFPKRPWFRNNELFLNTNQKYTINSYLINIDSGVISELPYNGGSQLVLDTKDSLVIVLRRNFLVPDVVAIGKLAQANSIASVQWVEITEKIEVPEIKGSVYKYFDLIAPEGSVKNFNAIYLGPQFESIDRKVPLIVWPHGGPHTAFANYFFLEAAIFLSLGYAIILINYRGSTGSGEDSVNFLPGKVGTADVKDCIQAVDTVLANFSHIDSNQLALCGGSHGGFLVTHLSGQYPDKFKSVVARNPVIDVASMSIISDIPDWCYVEGGEPYTQKGQINNDILLKMRELSPIVHAHNVKAPTLLQIGSKDLRVPHHQGEEYLFRLKANNVKARMNLYNDNHPLGTVRAEIDNIINTILWTEENLGRE